MKAAPEIADAAFDRLFERLQAIEARFPDLVTPDSPTRRVGAPPADAHAAVEQAAPLLGLEAAREAQDRRWRSATSSTTRSTGSF